MEISALPSVTGFSDRVLVLTHNRIQPFTGGGVVLASLFHQIPRDNLFILHTDDTPNGEGGYREHRLRPALRPTSVEIAGNTAAAIAAVLRAPHSFSRADLSHIATGCLRFTMPAALERSIADFAPTVIYAWVGDLLWARFVEEVVTRYRVPYVVHFMDNHVEVDPRSRVEVVIRNEFRRRLGRVVSGAERIFTITSAMGVAYERMFCKPHDVFHSLIEPCEWPWPGERESRAPFTLAFTGSAEGGQVSGLRDVSTAVDALRESGIPARVVLYLTDYYTAKVRPQLAGAQSVEYRPHPDARGLRSALLDADLLILAYGFDRQYRQYYRYSFPTKIVPYMLSGRPVLAYGPESIEPIEYVRRGGWGQVVTEPDPAGLADEIRRLIQNPEYRVALARAAYSAGVQEHDLQTHSRRFRTALSEIAAAARG